jgi:hypothetical protein
MVKTRSAVNVRCVDVDTCPKQQFNSSNSSNPSRQISKAVLLSQASSEIPLSLGILAQAAVAVNSDRKQNAKLWIEFEVIDTEVQAFYNESRGVLPDQNTTENPNVTSPL